jgi:glycosyltransferase involved in cell wall biosynthesis
VLLFSEGPLAQKLREIKVEPHILPLSRELLDARKDSLGASSLGRLREIFSTLGAVRQVARFIRRLKPDLVHTNSLKSDLIGGFAARLARRPLIWHVRDRIDEQYLPKKVVKVFRFLARHIPTCVLANSRSTLETLKLPPGKCAHVAYSGIDFTPYEIPEVPRGGREDAPKIGLVGRIARWKGQHIFIQAAALVRQQFPAAQFDIIGAALFEEEDYEREIRAQVARLGLKEVVHFDGFRQDVAKAVHDLDLLVHASITGEPFGQVVVEGMAARKPVVATAGGGVPEIVEDGKTGLLVPMNDAKAMGNAICGILENPQRADEMGRAGHARVREHFTAPITTRSVEAIYDRMLDAQSSPNQNIYLIHPQRQNP